MHASRGLIALLAATVIVGVLWIVMLKPGGSSPASGGSPTHGLSGYQADIAKAHQAVQTSAAGNARSGADPAGAASSAVPAATGRPAASTGPADAAHTVRAHAAAKAGHGSAASHSTTARSGHRTAVATSHRSGAAGRLSQVQRAIRAHKVVALLFYNPSAADDQAVKRELAAVATHRGRVVKLTIPLGEIANYTAVTQQVPVNFSPTLVLVAGNGQADEIVGYTDQFEIAQRVDQALAAR